MNIETDKRITLKRVRPNPLFQEWLEELYGDAKDSKSKLEHILKEALDSLSKYPLPLQTGAECIVLKGFDKKLCKHLDNCLEVYKQNLAVANLQNNDNLEENGISATSQRNEFNINSSEQNQHNFPIVKQDSTSTSNRSYVSDTDTINSDPSTSSEVNKLLQNNKKQQRNKKYKPVYRSGGYAILIALLEACIEQPASKSLTKQLIIEKAQKHSEESFVRSNGDSFYTAWSNMSKLVSKGLITKVRHKKVEYSLTEEGLKLAKELFEESKNKPTMNDIIFIDNSPSTYSDEENDVNANTSLLIEVNDSSIELPAGSFDVILLIDKNETGGLSKKNDPTMAQFNKYPDLKHEYRSLKVGDYAWIAKHKTLKDQELVLPYIIERKRMDDLGASIKDGRFHEQKFRLRKCGLKNVIYLVENYGSNKHVGLPIQNLMQALTNTRVQDGFKIHITDSLTNSARFLAMMTKRLTIRYKNRHLNGHNSEATNDMLMTFQYFNMASSKSKALTVTETFIKLLLQLKGLSVEKALAITAKYKTPRSLIIAYKKCDRTEGEYLLANLKYGSSRNVGLVVSKTIYQLFSDVGFS